MIRLYDGYVMSCCKATPDKLTIPLLQQDSRAFFNWPNIKQERQQMLDNQRVSGCEVCWQQEDRGLASRRTNKAHHPRYQGLIQTPKYLTIEVSNTCNLTCSYCCKNYSHTWLRDIMENGDYEIEGHADRYNANDMDRVVYRLSQKEMQRSRFEDLIRQQIAEHYDALEKIVITGGEPLLYNDLEPLVRSLPGKYLEITTGLGISTSRLKAVLDRLSGTDVRFGVSAENLGLLHQFNRYGSDAAVFEKNLELLQSRFPVEINSTLSNLTLFGFPEFFKKHNQSIKIRYHNNIVLEPDFMNPNMLDPGNKSRIVEELSRLGEFTEIIKIIMAEPNLDLRPRLQKYLERFCSTRSLSLDIYPRDFVQWIYCNEKAHK